MLSLHLSPLYIPAPFPPLFRFLLTVPPARPAPLRRTVPQPSPSPPSQLYEPGPPLTESGPSAEFRGEMHRHVTSLSPIPSLPLRSTLHASPDLRFHPLCPSALFHPDSPRRDPSLPLHVQLPTYCRTFLYPTLPLPRPPFAPPFPSTLYCTYSFSLVSPDI